MPIKCGKIAKLNLAKIKVIEISADELIFIDIAE